MRVIDLVPRPDDGGYYQMEEDEDGTLMIRRKLTESEARVLEEEERGREQSLLAWLASTS